MYIKTYSCVLSCSFWLSVMALFFFFCTVTVVTLWHRGCCGSETQKTRASYSKTTICWRTDRSQGGPGFISLGKNWDRTSEDSKMWNFGKNGGIGRFTADLQEVYLKYLSSKRLEYLEIWFYYGLFLIQKIGFWMFSSSIGNLGSSRAVFVAVGARSIPGIALQQRSRSKTSDYFVTRRLSIDGEFMGFSEWFSGIRLMNY